MKVIIVGAGIAGLSVYLHLLKHIPSLAPPDLAILERAPLGHDTLDTDAASRVPGGIGLVCNGMRVLRRLDPALHRRVAQAGCPCEHMAIQTARGWTLGLFPQRSAHPTPERTVMLSRRRLWETLRDAVERIDPAAIRQTAAVVSAAADGTVTLADGRTLAAELVIGADGVKSVARAAVVGPDEPGRRPVYHDLMNVFGVMPASYLASAPASVAMIFGQTGHFGASRMGGPDQAFWWSTYPHTVSASDEHGLTTQPLDAAGKQALLARHESWASPVVQAVLADLSAGSAHPNTPTAVGVQTPTWSLPKLPRWSRGRLVLIGDAAHAMPPTSGQGASQALEDAAALALLLARVWEEAGAHEPRLGAALAAFEAVRRPRVEAMLDDSLKRQEKKRGKTLVQTLLMYLFLWLAHVSMRLKRQTGAPRLDYDIEQAVASVSL